MELLAAWLLYPLALGAITVGLGLLLARLAAWDLPRALLPGIGLAALFALSRLITATEATAPFALPLVLVLAVAGFASNHRLLRGPLDVPALAGALAVFAIFAAPTVLSGEPTFAGYTSLPDTSHQLALAEQYREHGPAYGQLPHSSYTLALAKYIDTAYPVAGQTAMGITSPLGLLDVAWLYQAFLAFLCATTFGTVLVLIRPLVASRWLRVGVAFVAAQPALLMSFFLQGSIKELGAATMVVLGATVLATAREERRPARSLLPLAVVGAAAFGALGPASGPYLIVLLLAALVVWGRPALRNRDRGSWLWIGGGAAVALVLSVPMLASIRTAVVVNSGTLDNAQDLGNLAGPLRPVQAFGVWLNGDFRFAPDDRRLAYALAGLAAALAVVGALWLVRRRAFGPLLLLVTLAVPSVYLLRKGSPYADAKVLMVMSPALLLTALLGAVGLWQELRGRLRVVGLALAAVLGAGVLASNALAYHDVSLAPQDRYAELLEINDELAGKGPVVSTEYDEFGEYFLRDAAVRSQPEYPHGYRDAPYQPNALADPQRRPSLKTPLDPDDLTLEYLEEAPYLVVRRSPTASRPPSNYERVREGRWYDVWRRTETPRVLEHRPLGLTAFDPAGVASCTDVREVARIAREAGGRLAYVERAEVPTLMLQKLPLRGQWYQYGAFPGAVVPKGPGRAPGVLLAPRAGTYRVWLQGSTERRVDVRVDGRTVGGVAGQLNNPGNWEQVAELRLDAGRHRIDVVGGGGTLAPGTGGYWASLRQVGPVMLSPQENENIEVATVAASEWRTLCGRRLDWLEAVA